MHLRWCNCSKWLTSPYKRKENATKLPIFCFLNSKGPLYPHFWLQSFDTLPKLPLCQILCLLLIYWWFGETFIISSRPLLCFEPENEQCPGSERKIVPYFVSIIEPRIIYTCQWRIMSKQLQCANHFLRSICERTSEKQKFDSEFALAGGVWH